MKQREIKFRAWDKKSKEWLLGYEYPSLGGFSMFGEVMLFGEWSEVVGRFIVSQKDRTPDDIALMQYTGLKDKNGKEIYEGDVVHHGYTYDAGDVGRDSFEGPGEPWEPGNAVIEGGGWSFSMNQLSGGCWRFSGPENDEWDLRCIEVIGNIYENPELLKP